MDKQLEKELQRIGGELAIWIGKRVYREIKQREYDKKVIVRVGGKRPKLFKKKAKKK